MSEISPKVSGSSKNDNLFRLRVFYSASGAVLDGHKLLNKYTSEKREMVHLFICELPKDIHNFFRRVSDCGSELRLDRSSLTVHSVFFQPTLSGISG